MYLDHTHVAMRTWATLGLAISLSPVAVWAWTVRQDKRAETVRAVPVPSPPPPEPVYVAGPTPSATTAASAGTTATTTAGGN